MELVIKSNLDIKDFCIWLINKMKDYIITNLDNNYLIKWDKFINNNVLILFENNQKRYISSKDILIGAAYNLEVLVQGNQTRIQINSNINIPNTHAKFINIVKLITYGCLEVPPYPLFNTMTEYFARNINLYFDSFAQGDL